MDIIIIGGGIQGLCTAEYLSRQPGVQVSLVERFGRQHHRGSSHGQTRITRSTYSDALYVRLMQDAHQRLWPALERRVDSTLITAVQGCFFGPLQGIFPAYKQAIVTGGAAVEELSVAQARQRFPMFQINDDDGVLLDHTAGMIHAQRCIAALWRVLEQRGVRLLKDQVIAIEPDSLRLRLRTSTLQPDRLVVCAGPWAPDLFPQLLKSRVQVVRQFISYWRLREPILGRAPQYPVWVELGSDPTDNWYGLPDSNGEGIKVARHCLVGDDDPELDLQTVSPLELARIRLWMVRRMQVETESLAHTETCLYSVTGNEDFILDQHPDNDRLVIGAGFSGHGFKFGPVVGEILGQLVLEGGSENALFEENRRKYGAKNII